MKPVVAIVGRPNVGKSTLFNRIIGSRKAVVANEPGVTRDLNYSDVEELGRVFTLVDTGGFEPVPEDAIFAQVREQAMLAIEEANLIVVLLDSKAGLVPQDRELVDMVRRSGKTALFAVNKVDSPRQEAFLGDFYSLGLEEIFPVSGEHGGGVAELLDAVVELLPRREEPTEAAERVGVAVVGRPNAGKSSILNRILGKRRSIVSETAGTTRDAVDTPFERCGKSYIFIDTAGIRKKNRISLRVESYCVMEAIRSIDRCDVAVLVIDASRGVSTQDEKIAGLIEDRAKGCVIAVNKWDLVEKDTGTAKLVEDKLRERLPFISYAPVVLVSAMTGQRTDRLLDEVDRVVEASQTRVATSPLNTALSRIKSRHKPPVYKGRPVKFYYMTQTGVSPVRFAVFTNYPEGVGETYRRYFTNRLREELGLTNVPIRVHFRKRR